MAQLGIVTYNIAKDWDLNTILARLEKLGYEGVELRTSHAHKVEVNLTKAEREAVRNRFEDSPVQLAGLGSAFEYQSADPAEVRKNIEGTKEYVRLAHDVGSPGVKVRPNGIPKRCGPRCHITTDRPIASRGGRVCHGVRGGNSRGSSWKRDIQPRQLREDYEVRRPSQRLTPAGTPISRTSRTARSRKPLPWSRPKFTKYTSATSPTKHTLGACCSPY